MGMKELRPSKSVRQIKLEELKNDCNAAIIGGINVNGEKFSLELEDQKNILALSLAAAQGQSVPYHADGEPCRLYTPEEFTAIANAATAYATYQTTYFNALKQWVNRAEAAEIGEIFYGAQLPADLAEYMTALLRGGQSD